MRAWHQPGRPLPDAVVQLAAPDGRGAGTGWLEVDCGTESRTAWRRKLADYQGLASQHFVLVAALPLRGRHLLAEADRAGIRSALLELPGRGARLC